MGTNENKMLRAGLSLVLVALLSVMAVALPRTAAHAATNLVTNASFDDGGTPTQTPAGWNEAEGATNSYTEPNGGARTGNSRLTQWGTTAYQSYTYQIVSGLANGSYTMSAWVRSSGGQNKAYMELKNYGGATVNTPIPTTNTWTQINLTVTVSSGQAWLGFYSDAAAQQWIYVDDVTFTSGTGTAPSDPTMSYANWIQLPKTAPDTGYEEVRDPAITRDGNTYYIVYTVYPFTDRSAADPSKPDDNSSPGIKLYKSTDLKTWTFDRWLVKSSDLPDNSPYKHRFWAPEIHKINGKYYLDFTADNWFSAAYNIGGQWGYHMFVGVADTIEGPYTHISDSGQGCDATLFADPTTGKTYIVAPYTDLYIQQVDLTQLATQNKVVNIGPQVKIVSADNSDIGYPTSPQYLEGPWVTVRNGKFYLWHAAYYGPNNDQGYWTNVAYATNPMGPYTKDAHAKLFWGGHVAAFDGPDGGTWLSYRGEDPANPDAIGRPNVDPMTFDANGNVVPKTPTEGPVYFPYQVTERFDTDNDSAWTDYGGAWSAATGKYTVAVDPGAKALVSNTTFSSLTYTGDVTANGGNAGLIFRVSNPSVGADSYQGYYAGIDTAGNVVLGKANNGWTQLALTPMTITPGAVYHLKVTAIGSSIKVYVNDMTAPKIAVTDTTYTTGLIGVRTYNAAASFDNLVATN